MFEKLRAHFPEKDISWRPSHMNHQKTQAMALAYIDSRDVMERLDAVCGPAGWQSEHFDCGGGRMGCKIGIYIKADHTGPEVYGQWIWKSDGAGATQVEGDKGAFSDAFKRAAVSWGVGRYLYAMGATWVPCETHERNGKTVFKRFKDDPWAHVANKVWRGPLNKDELKEKLKALGADMHACEEEDQLITLLFTAVPVIEQCKIDMPGNYSGNIAGKGLAVAIEDHKKRVKENQT